MQTCHELLLELEVFPPVLMLSEAVRSVDLNCKSSLSQ